MAKRGKPDRKVDDRHLRINYKGGRCAVCKRSIAAIERRFLTSKGTHDFNHIDPLQKSPIYDKLIRRVISAEQLDELDKCNLLCKICHGIWHNQRVKGVATVTTKLPDGRVVKKRVRHHGMMEIKNGKPRLHFFADEPCHLGVFMYRLGGGRAVYRLGFELEKDLQRLLLATRRRRTLAIWDAKGLVFKADRLDSARLKFAFLVRFSVGKCEFRTDDPNYSHVWVRCGKMIIKGRGVRDTGQVSGEMGYATLERALRKMPHLA